MKRNASSTIARITASALLLVSSLVLTLVAIKIDVVDLGQIATAKEIGPMLLGPERSSNISANFSKQSRKSIVAAPASLAVTPAPTSGDYVGFELFEAPGTLVNVTSTSQGPAASTVEYIGHDAGEPSIGVNWQSTQDSTNGMTAYQSDLQTDFVKFDDSCPASGLKATCYNSQAPTSDLIDSDPIGFVNPRTG